MSSLHEQHADDDPLFLASPESADVSFPSSPSPLPRSTELGYGQYERSLGATLNPSVRDAEGGEIYIAHLQDVLSPATYAQLSRLP